jgi:hypothetical protein
VDPAWDGLTGGGVRPAVDAGGATVVMGNDVGRAFLQEASTLPHARRREVWYARMAPQGWKAGVLFAAVRVAVMLVAVWQYPVSVAERRERCALRAITVLTYVSALVFPLWAVALLWACMGRRR